MHYGESIKAIGNEVGMCEAFPGEMCHAVVHHQGCHTLLLQEFGDGIMSAIDMFATIHSIEGKLGEKRMVITLNGKVRPWLGSAGTRYLQEALIMRVSACAHLIWGPHACSGCRTSSRRRKTTLPSRQCSFWGLWKFISVTSPICSS